MNKKRKKLLLKAKRFLHQKNTAIKQVVAQCQHIRKGSKLSRIGRLILEKTKQKAALGALIALIIPAASFHLPVANTSQTILTPEALAASYAEEEAIVNTPSTIQFPLENFHISQGYHFYHRAIDLAAPLGTPLYPIAAGQVKIANFSRYGLGNYIVIRHGAGFYSVYAHLSFINVKPQEKVGLETMIGRVGSTGHSTGPHLHLEVIVDNQKINPLTILPKE